jgi:hypothetical protein
VWAPQIRRFAQRRLADALVRHEENRAEFALLAALKLVTLDAPGAGAAGAGDQSARQLDSQAAGSASLSGGWHNNFGGGAHRPDGTAAAAAAAAAAAVRTELAAMREEMRKEMAEVRGDVRREAESLRAEMRQFFAAPGAGKHLAAAAAAAATDDPRRRGVEDEIGGDEECESPFSSGYTPKPVGHISD